MTVLEVVREIPGPDGLTLRWSPYPADPDTSVLLIVGTLDPCRWVLSAAHRENPEDYARGTADTFTAPDETHRAILAYGVPWAKLDALMLGQMAEQFLGASPHVMSELGRIPLDELEALRAVLDDRPHSMSEALYLRRMVFEGAADSRPGPWPA